MFSLVCVSLFTKGPYPIDGQGGGGALLLGRRINWNRVPSPGRTNQKGLDKMDALIRKFKQHKFSCDANFDSKSSNIRIVYN